MAVARLVPLHLVTFFLFLGFAISGWTMGTRFESGYEANVEDTPQNKPKHEAIANVVLTCYVLAGLGFLVYLAEDMPWHKTQQREHAFLSLLLALVFSAPAVVWFDPTHGTPRRHYDQLQHLMMATVVVRVALSMTSPQRFPGFFEHRSNSKSSFFMKQRPATSLQGSRVVLQLDELVSQVLDLERGTFARMPDSVFYSVQLGLFMLVQLTTLYPTLLKNSVYLIYPWWALLWGMMLWDMTKRYLKVAPRQNEIDHLLERVVLQDANLLRYTLWEMNLPTLMEVGTSETARLLTTQALQQGHLEVVDKAIIIDALQKRGIKLWREHQNTVTRFMLTCQGRELTLLKNLIDTGGDYYNLYKLVYEDITRKEQRQLIKSHLRDQALALRKIAPSRKGTCGGVGIKILSDVDDTLYSSGGSFPAGCDKSFPKHRVYPGCLELFRALDWSFTDEEPSCNLVFLSARPHVYKSLMEDGAYRVFRRLIAENRLHCLPTLLPGNLWRGLCAMLTYCCRKTKAWRRVGELKFTTFTRYAQLYLEYDYVFCGDNGQGDLLAGQRMVAYIDSELSESESESVPVDPCPQVLAVLIHEVMPDSKVLALEPPAPADRGSEWREELRKRRIFFHKTYLGAAAQLCRDCPGLLSFDDLRDVTDKTLMHFDADVKYCEWAGHWSDYKDRMQLDCREVVRMLTAAGVEPPGELPWESMPNSRGSAFGSACSEAEGSSDESDAALMA